MPTTMSLSIDQRLGKPEPAVLGNSLATLQRSLREIQDALQSRRTHTGWFVGTRSSETVAWFDFGVVAKDGEAAYQAMRAFVSGVKQLRDGPTLPEFYSVSITKRFRFFESLAKQLGADAVRIGTNDRDDIDLVVLDADIYTHAKSVSMACYHSLGSLSGRLIHIRDGLRGPSIAGILYEDRTRRGIKASFPASLKEELRESWARRVALVGEIERNSSHQAFAIKVHEIRPMPQPDETPVCFQDLSGIEPNWTGGVDSVQYIRELRGA